MATEPKSNCLPNVQNYRKIETWMQGFSVSDNFYKDNKFIKFQENYFLIWRHGFLPFIFKEFFCMFPQSIKIRLSSASYAFSADEEDRAWKK